MFKYMLYNLLGHVFVLDIIMISELIRRVFLLSLV